MKLKKALSALALGVAAAGAHAIPTIINKDGTNTFSSFDWAANASAFATGFQPVANTPFTFTFYAWAATLQDGDGDTLALGNLDNKADGVKKSANAYEYTIVATLNEVVKPGCNPIGICEFQITGGTFAIYYDTAANANGVLGTGFADGTAMVTGHFDVQNSGNFEVEGAQGNGSGKSSIKAVIDSFDDTLIKGINVGGLTTLVTTLQQGTEETRPATAKPTKYNGLPFPANIQLFQADANQSFVSNAVPEPSSLALVGLALAAGAGVTTRRRLKK